MKRTLTFLLAMLLLLPIVTACGNDTQEPTDTSGDESVSEAESDAPYELPEKDYDGRKLRILVPPGKIWQFEEHTVNPTVLNAALFSRNTAVEFGYGVELEYVYNGENASAYNKLLNAELTAQLGSYDLCFYPNTYGMIGMVVNSNYFSDLCTSKYIDFSREWWGHDLNSVTTINGQAYAAVGYGSIELMSAAKGLFFNKDLYREVFNADPSELYTMVRDKQWTLERLSQMSIAATRDLDGNSEMSETDRYGMTADFNAIGLIYSLGATFVTKDQNDSYVLNFSDEHNVDVFQALFTFLNSGSFLFVREGFQKNAELFNNGTVLFSLNTFDNGVRIQGQGINYGILPLPMYAANGSYNTAHAASYFSIPTTVNDAEFSEILLNAFHYYSYEKIRPAYRNTVLQVGISQQAADAEMVDLILDSLAPDFSYVFRASFGYHDNAILNLILAKDTGYAGYYRENKETFQAQLNTILGLDKT